MKKMKKINIKIINKMKEKIMNDNEIFNKKENNEKMKKKMKEKMNIKLHLHLHLLFL